MGEACAKTGWQVHALFHRVESHGSPPDAMARLYDLLRLREEHEQARAARRGQGILLLFWPDWNCQAVAVFVRGGPAVHEQHVVMRAVARVSGTVVSQESRPSSRRSGTRCQSVNEPMISTVFGATVWSAGNCQRKTLA